MKKLVKLVRSANGCDKRQKGNLASFRLKKIGDTFVLDYNDSSIGRIKKIQNLIVVEDL